MLRTTHLSDFGFSLWEASKDARSWAGLDTPTFWMGWVSSICTRTATWIYLADLNNDGWLDLFVPDITADRSFILWGGREGFSMDRCQPLGVWHASCARAADLSGNGCLDLIVGGGYAISRWAARFLRHTSYWNGPSGLRGDARTLLLANAVNALTVADFNNNGLLDLFVCSYHDNRERDIDSYIYWHRPGRGFSAADRLRLSTHSASGCVAADLNDDGWIDLAIAYHKVAGDHAGHSAVWWNGPDGFRPDRVTELLTAGPHGMVSAPAGNIMNRGPEEYCMSASFKLLEGLAVRAISWEAEIPAKSWVRAQLRFVHSRIAGGSKTILLTHGDSLYSPEVAQAYWSAVQAADWSTAREIIACYDMPYFDYVGQLSGGFETGVHGTLELVGLGQRWRRLPYRSLTDEEMERLPVFCGDVRC